MTPKFYRLHHGEDIEVQQRRFEKALQSHHEKILFCGPWLAHSESLNEFIKILDGKNRKACLCISHRELSSLSSAAVTNAIELFSELVISLSSSEQTYSGHLEFLFRFKDKISFLLEFSELFDVHEFFSAMPIWIREKIFFHPCAVNLKAKQIYLLGHDIQKKFPEVHFQPLPGLDHFDLRISNEVHLMPEGTRELHLQTQSDIKPDISVIIPTYDNQEYLINCLRHLLLQNIDRKKYEILVVDDGTPTLKLDDLKSFLLPEEGELNFSYFYLPKKIIPNSSFGNFRAGLCRNFGFYHSRGNHITFLDSDMLTPPAFLSNILSQLQTADLVQSVRHHIHPSKSDRFVRYESVAKKDLFIEEKSYWGPFFDSESWMNIPDFWKYTCTYSLSMTRSFFEMLGQFRKSYVCYGFEDTDFGYQAYKKGARFALDKTVLYHLTPYTDKSRYKHSMFYKHQLLRLTAKTFYLNTLSDEVYSKLKTLMD